MREQQSDLALLQNARSGDREAFGQFYLRYREALLGYLARRVDSPEVAADVMAEAFARALVAVVKSDNALPEQPPAWLFAIARNELIDAARRGRVAEAARKRLALPPLVLDDRDIERIADISASTQFLENAQAALPSREWEALRDHVVNEEPYPDLAGRLGCSEAVVRKRVSRAKAHLRTALRGSHA